MTIERARLGDVLALRRRAVEVELDTWYTEIGVRSFGRGLFHKEPVSGADLGAKRVFRIEPGDLVISNVFAWEGAIAVASQEETGTIGSHRFMTFVPIDDERIDSGWAAWFLRSEPGLELIGRASPGSAGRNRTLAIDRLEALEIPLPPIDDQRRLAARLNRLQSSVANLARGSDHASTVIDALAVSAATRPELGDTEKAQAGWRRVQLGEIMTPANSHVTVKPDSSYPNVGILSFGRGLFAKPDIDGATTSARLLTRVRAGQFIYSRLFAFEGAYGYVPHEFEGYFVSNEFPTFDVEPRELDARWLANYLRSPNRWAELGGASKGLGVRRQRVPVEAVLSYQVWLPPIDVQQAVSAFIDRLDRVRAKVVQAERKIAALVPAELNEAFARIS